MSQSLSSVFNRHILVHEPVSRWTAELERAFLPFPEIGFRWRPYRKELMEELTLASLVLLVVAPDDPSLDLIREIKRIDRSLPIACAISVPHPEWEWVARESGVDIVLPDTSEIERVACSLQRRLRISPAKPECLPTGPTAGN
jgi:hypothetical protein